MILKLKFCCSVALFLSFKSVHALFVFIMLLLLLLLLLQHCLYACFFHSMRSPLSWAHEWAYTARMHYSWPDTIVATIEHIQIALFWRAFFSLLLSVFRHFGAGVQKSITTEYQPWGHKNACTLLISIPFLSFVFCMKSIRFIFFNLERLVNSHWRALLFCVCSVLPSCDFFCKCIAYVCCNRAAP